MATNITWHHGHIKRGDREQQLNQHGVTLWFTGLSGSGKSTIATELERQLVLCHKKSTYVLDGDNIRHGLNSDLGFSPKDRQENIRRIGEVCKLFTDAGIIVLAAFVSPYEEDRNKVRSLLEENNGSNNNVQNPSPKQQSPQSSCHMRNDFIEVYVEADISICESRDPKGLYKRARTGEISNFTGIDAPFEIPTNPELVLNTGKKSLEDCVSILLTYLAQGGYLSS